MRAIVCREYGKPEVLKLENIAKPVPKNNEILVKIISTAVNSGDLRLRRADPWAVRLFFGLTKPKNPVLGGVFSGEIEAIGKSVSRYKVGDKIFGATGMTFGAYAEYKCLVDSGIFSLKPENISHAQASVIPFGGTTALHFLRKANITPGQQILVYGASGSVGTAAVQLAKYYGGEVTAVCSTTNVELMKSLGASEVIDYTKENFTKNEKEYDVIFETVNKLSFADSIKCLKPTGILILGASEFPGMIKGLWTNITCKQKVITGMISQKSEDILFLKGLIEKGKLKAVIDKSYMLEEMADAHAYAELGHKKGNIAISVANC